MKKLLMITTVFLLFNITSSSIHSTGTPTVKAQTAIVYEVNNDLILYSKGGKVQGYPASLTKLMTALLIIESFELDDKITISENAIQSLEPGSSSIGMKASEIITINDALHGLLLMSANEVANGLAEAHSGTIENFVKTMNQRALELGANDTLFVNPHGLHDASHVTTPYDLALITAELIKHDSILSIMKDSLYEIPATNLTDEVRPLYQQHKMVNSKNDLTIYREDAIAGKVGYTKEANNTLLTVTSNGERTLIVVLFNSEAVDKYPDTDTLIEYGYSVDLQPYLDAKSNQATGSTEVSESIKDIYTDEIVLPNDSREQDLKDNLLNDPKDSTEHDSTNKNKKNPWKFIWLIFLVPLAFVPTLSKRKINKLHEKYKGFN